MVWLSADCETPRFAAAPTTAVTHIAIQERDADGKVVDWLDKVSDAEYLAGPKRG